MKIKINLFVNRAIQILLLFLFVINFSFGLYVPLMAVFITNFISGATLTTIGLAMAFYAIAKSVVQIPMSRKLDKHPGEKDDFFALITGGTIAVIYPFILFFISASWHLYLLEILIGIGDGALMAAYYAVFSRHTDKGSEGFEWSLFSVGGLTISAALAGAIGGILADTFGIKPLFIISGILNIVAVAVIFSLYPYLDGTRKRISFPPNIPPLK